MTSSIAGSADDRRALHSVIRSFFENLSTRHDQLSHLRNIEIDLRYWDDIIGQAARFTPLFYRWFGGLPLGFGEINLSFGSGSGFKRFLESDNLPYFGGDAFLSDTGGQAASLFDATLRELTAGEEARARVISGPGGIGKTRLAIELCNAAREHGWWPVRLERNANAADLRFVAAR